MRSLMRPALMFVALMTLLTGVLYPAAITGLAQLLFPSQANGSLIVVDGTARGSRLIGQPFSAPGYLWSRPPARRPTTGPPRAAPTRAPAIRRCTTRWRPASPRSAPPTAR
jgi:K+-transporting ATPase ATPase C chain